MTIIDDNIEFAASDFDGLSDFAKKAITELALSSTPTLDGVFEDVFSRLLNDYVTAAKDSLKSFSAQTPSVEAVLEGYAAADAAKRAAADLLLADIEVLLKS